MGLIWKFCDHLFRIYAWLQRAVTEKNTKKSGVFCFDQQYLAFKSTYTKKIDEVWKALFESFKMGSMWRFCDQRFRIYTWLYTAMSEKIPKKSGFFCLDHQYLALKSTFTKKSDKVWKAIFKSFKMGSIWRFWDYPLRIYAWLNTALKEKNSKNLIF